MPSGVTDSCVSVVTFTWRRTLTFFSKCLRLTVERRRADVCLENPGGSGEVSSGSEAGSEGPERKACWEMKSLSLRWFLVPSAEMLFGWRRPFLNSGK